MTGFSGSDMVDDSGWGLLVLMRLVAGMKGVVYIFSMEGISGIDKRSIVGGFCCGLVEL